MSVNSFYKLIAILELLCMGWSFYLQDYMWAGISGLFAVMAILFIKGEK